MQTQQFYVTIRHKIEQEDKKMTTNSALQRWETAIDKHNKERHPERETARAKETRLKAEADRFLAEEALSFKSASVATPSGGVQQSAAPMSKYEYMMKLRGASNERKTPEEMERLQGRQRTMRTRATRQYVNA